MKLELKHLAPYLPYGITGQFNLNQIREDYKIELRTKIMREDNVDFFLKYCKPILRPLSDLTKDNFELIYKGTDDNSDIIKYLSEHINNGKGHIAIQQIDYWRVVVLLKHHFDVFGLIDKGLAIDINTLDT